MTTCPPIQSIESLARDALPPAEAAPLLDHARACPACSALLESVRRNLALEGPVSAVLRDPVTPVPSGPLGLVGRTIDHYRVIRVLGSGGSSTVYEAVDTATSQSVAIKVLSPFAATPEHTRRFVHEVHLLARLDHPGIARVLGSGSFDDDRGPRPYLVMELVRGQPITRHCESLRLPVVERLALLARACDAVQHAHDVGIIHRDLKPANILVTSTGDARVLDFGVARADTDAPTMHTATGQVVGTITYMSPEHLRGATHVDARSDVYALGVIAYELAAGEPPFALAGASLQAAIRLITMMDPARPSAASTLDRAAPLSSDIDTVILRALEKDPRDRYASAREFADDLRRVAQGAHARAKPPGPAQRARRFARRNRALATGVTAVFVALLLGLAGTTIGMVKAVQRQRLAESRRRDAQQLSSLLESMLRQAHPHEDKGRGYTVRQMLDDFARRFQSHDVSRQPEVETSLRTTIGTGYRVLGEYTLARPHLARAMELRRDARFAHATSLARATEELAMLDHDEGKYDDAIARFVAAAAAAPDDGEVRARSLMGQSDCLRHKGDFRAAREIGTRAVPAAEATSNPLLAAESHLNLSRILRDAGEYDAAQPEFDAAMRGFTATLPDTDPRLADAFNDGAWLAFLRRDFTAAHDTAQHALDVGTASLGENHPDVANSLYELALITGSQGNTEQAIALLRRAITIYQTAHGDDHASTFTAKEALTRVLRSAQRPEEALPLVTDVLAARRMVFGDRNIEVAYALSTLALVQHDLQDNEGAARSLTEAIDIYKATYHKPHPFTAGCLRELSSVRADQGEYGAALTHAREGVAAFEASLGERHPDTLAAIAQLASVHEARAEWGNALATHERIDGLCSPSTPAFRAILALQGRGRCLVRMGRADEGIAHLRQAVEQFTSLAGEHPTPGAAARLTRARHDLDSAAGDTGTVSTPPKD